MGPRQKLNFFRIWSCCISSLLPNTQNSIKYFPLRHTLDPGDGSKGQIIYFSERSHVAYQIKADDAGKKMVANILPSDTPLTQLVGQKVKLYIFLKVVMLPIKLKLTTLPATW